MLGDPRECREHAKHCLKLAAETADAQVKKRYETLARRWLALAKDLEVTAALIKKWGSPAPPTEKGRRH